MMYKENSLFHSAIAHFTLIIDPYFFLFVFKLAHHPYLVAFVFVIFYIVLIHLIASLI